MAASALNIAAKPNTPQARTEQILRNLQDSEQIMQDILKNSKNAQGDRLFLLVSKAEKDDLKALNIGAKWHKDDLKWSVPLDADLSKIPANWLPNDIRIHQANSNELAADKQQAPFEIVRQLLRAKQRNMA